MPTVRRPARPLAAQSGAGLLGVLVLLAVLAATVGLRAPGALIGVAYGSTLTVLLFRAMQRSGRTRLGPADAVTLARAVLIGGLTALVADSFSGSAQVPVMVTLASVALALDAVDGRVARRTGTVCTVGARFDMEVDAVLLLVLSVYDVRLLGGWVLLIGAARYLFVAASWVWPWLRGPTPPRFWGKVVAAVQGVVLTVAMAELLPGPVVALTTVAALSLLAESFGRQVWWLHRNRRTRRVHCPRHPRSAGASRAGGGDDRAGGRPGVVRPGRAERSDPAGAGGVPAGPGGGAGGGGPGAGASAARGPRAGRAVRRSAGAARRSSSCSIPGSGRPWADRSTRCPTGATRVPSFDLLGGSLVGPWRGSSGSAWPCWSSRCW